MMVFSGNTRILLLPLLSLFLSLLMNKAQSFNMPGELSLPSSRFVMRYPNTQLEGGPTSKGGDTKNDNSMNEVIARRLIVSGNVNGGYIRTCIMNEAGRFRRLVGTMSPPDENSDSAEIYVEGKRGNVEGFIRWCNRGTKNVGLSQTLVVKEDTEETPVGLYDAFYVKVRE